MGYFVARILRFILILAIFPFITCGCFRGDTTSFQPIQTAPFSATPNSYPIPSEPTIPVMQETPEAVISTPQPGLMPHALYFLNNMGDGNNQVWRLSSDGATLTQITFEPYPVTDYAVSLANGSLAYITDNRLYYANTENGKRSLLVDGGPINQKDPATPDTANNQRISSPVWSPDGKSLAFGFGGINIFLPGYSKITRLLANGLAGTSNETGNGIQAIYAPYIWSPDSRRLLIEIELTGIGSTLGVLSMANGSLTRLHQPSAAPSNDLVCCQTSWSGDSNVIFVANFYIGLQRSGGLWRFDPASGAGMVLLPSTEKDGTYNYVGWPLQLKDGSLVYWFANTPEKAEIEMPMKLVASGPDAIFNRTLLRPEAFSPQEALWAEQARLVVIVLASPGTAARKVGGPVLLVRWQDSSAQPLLSDAYHLQWGL
jgi:hypothetical protein